LAFSIRVNEREQPPVSELRLQPRHQALMVDTVEEFLEVKIDDPLVSVCQIRLRLGDGRHHAGTLFFDR
jgi:hypothetical protein